jgi:hypothetical protein
MLCTFPNTEEIGELDVTPEFQDLTKAVILTNYWLYSNVMTDMRRELQNTKGEKRQFRTYHCGFRKENLFKTF